MGGLSHTVSGDIASFRTPSRVPIESLKFHFLPKQAAGTPSPENPIPIEGWTGLNGRKARKNLIKPYYTDVTTIRGLTITPTEKGVRVQGTATAEHPIRLSTQDVRFLDLGRKYTFSLYLNGDISGCKDPYLGYHTGETYKSLQNLDQSNNYKFTWTVPDAYANAPAPWFDMYIRVKEGSTVDFEIGLQMEAGENVTDYEPYSEELIPITFPSNGKNLYDISSYPLTQGRILWADDGTVDSGYSQFASTLNYIPCENIAGKIVTLNKRPGGWYGGVAFYTDSAGGYSYISGVRNNNQTAGTPMTFAVPKNAKYMRFSVPANTTDIQIELGEESTAFEPYSSDNTFYGGYVDPVAGEIVAEWVSETDNGKQWNIGYGNAWQWGHSRGADPDVTSINYYKKSLCTHSKNLSVSWRDNAHTIGLNQNGALYLGKEFWKLMGYEKNVTAQEVQNFFANQALAGTPVYICSPLETPIHVPVPAENMKAFLDHNNFWSDTNGITEVTYAVTESKDILATRKKAMEFDIGHRRKVKWNNMAGAMNNQYWVRYNSNMIDVDFENNEALITVKGTSSMPFSMSIRTNGDPIVYSDHHYYVSYCLYPYFDNAYFGAEFGNNVYTGYFYFEKDKWSRFSYRSKAGGDGMGRMYIPYFKPGSYAIGDSVRIKNAYYIDLTLMFGEGNEPTTAAEFEHICAINGIDLTTYQPYDTGSDRWLIIP